MILFKGEKWRQEKAAGEMYQESKSSPWYVLSFVILGHKFNYTERIFFAATQ